MKIKIINDLHIGAVRRGGTTPASREALRDWGLEEVDKLVHSCTSGPLIVLGDLFDTFVVTNRDWSAALEIFSKWLNNFDHPLVLVTGNHDWSPKGDALSSFHLLTDVLSRMYPERVRLVSGGVSQVMPSVYCVPHAPSQEVFELWLDSLNEVKDSFILLHANCMNPFSEGSLHSLNVDEVALRKLSKSNLVVFAHEHQFREPIPNVVVIGNSVPSSVSDLMGCDHKYCLEIEIGK